jgi:4-alpha-glucanotransferase
MQRKAGILCHPTSLPSPFGIGDLGKEAYRWVDLLAQYKQSLWQICPLGPVGYGYSPYNCHSSFAGNDLLLSPEKLREDGLLTKKDLEGYPHLTDSRVDFPKVIKAKDTLFRIAFARFKLTEEYRQFCEKEKHWLDDFALFMTIKKVSGNKSWDRWENSLKLRLPDAVQEVITRHRDELIYRKFLQYQFFRQWRGVHEYAGRQGVEIFGDLPYYVSFDSSDVWSSPDIFEIDKTGKPLNVGGVPPDCFSKSGQLWGNPIYNWKYLHDTGYAWWIRRIRTILELVDWIRIDHFRGFESYWSVPYGSPDAVNGTWEPGPGKEFFTVLEKELGSLPLVAEDLGMITREVEALRKSINLPGMRVLQFAFDGGEDNPHRPHHIKEDCVIYTGTHDNDTTIGWINGITKKKRKFIRTYLGGKEKQIFERLLYTAYYAPVVWCILPLQDVLQLDSRHRMNTPGTVKSCWQWRYTPEMLDKEKFEKIAEYTVASNRWRR